MLEFNYLQVGMIPKKDQGPKRLVTGTDGDLRKLSMADARALLRKFSVPEKEVCIGIIICVSVNIS